MIRPTVVRMWPPSRLKGLNSAVSCSLTTPASYESSASWAVRNTCGRGSLSGHLPLVSSSRFSPSSWAGPIGEVVGAEDHVLGGCRQRRAMGRGEDVVGGEHQDARLRLGLGREG